MIAFDIETTGLDPKKCAVTVVCTECLFTGQKRAFEFARLDRRRADVAKDPDMNEDERETELLTLEEQRDLLVEEMIQLFDDAHSLCAFNGVRFDIPFLMQAFDIPARTGTAWVLKTTDILECCRVLHKHTFKLDLLCEENNMPMKSGTGLAAIGMAKNGQFDKLRDYCADDVSILCNLYKQRHLINPRTKESMDLREWCRTDTYDMLMMMEIDDL